MNNDSVQCSTQLYRPVDYIKFQIISNRTINRISVHKEGIKTNSLNINSASGESKKDLFDPKMGSTEESIDCETCRLNTRQCPGHTSYINLEVCIFNAALLDYVESVLKCICHKCSKLLLPKQEKSLIDILMKFNGKHRLMKVKNLVKDIDFCQSGDYACNNQVGQIKFDLKNTTSQFQFVIKYEDDALDQTLDKDATKKVFLDANQVYQIFSRISDEDCQLMGFDPTYTRPENFITKMMIVPPPVIRPFKHGNFAGSKDDPLTSILSKIIKANMRIAQQSSKMLEIPRDQLTQQQMEEYAQRSADDRQLLQHIAVMYFDSQNKLLPKTYAKNSDAGITQRLKGKEGRLRRDIMGKRIDHNARTVITSGPHLSVRELGVPMQVALNIGKHVTVTMHNIAELQTYVNNGPNTFPGVLAVIQTKRIRGHLQTHRIDLKQSGIKNFQIKIGDTVERHLMNGDIVLFNRQPTLHKPSMQSFKAVITDVYTFQFNVSQTSPLKV